MKQERDNNYDWLERMAQAELECGGILAGRLDSPGGHPIEPVLHDEASLRKILADKFEQMQQKDEVRRQHFSTEKQKREAANL